MTDKKLEELIELSLKNPLIASTKDFFLGKSDVYDFKLIFNNSYTTIPKITENFEEYEKLMKIAINDNFDLVFRHYVQINSLILYKSKDCVTTVYLERLQMIMLQNPQGRMINQLRDCSKISHKFKLNIEYLYQIIKKLSKHINHQHHKEHHYEYIAKLYSQNKDFIEFYLNNKKAFTEKDLPFVAVAMSKFDCYDDEFTKITFKPNSNIKAVVPIYKKKPHLLKAMLSLLDSKKLGDRKFAFAIIKACYNEEYLPNLITSATNETNEKFKLELEEFIAENGASSSTSSNEKSSNIDKNISVLLKSEKSIKNIPIDSFYKVSNINGELIDISIIKASLIAVSKVKPLGASDIADNLLIEVNKSSLELFCIYLFKFYADSNYDTKQKWIIYFCSMYGGVAIFDIFVESMIYLYNNKRHALQKEIANSFICSKSPLSIAYLQNLRLNKEYNFTLSHTFNHYSNNNDLFDDTIPNLGFDTEDKIIFDYGTRKFGLYLKNDYSLAVIDEKGKIFDALPNVTLNDDKILSAHSQSVFNTIKKQTNTTLKQKFISLETDMIFNDTFSYERFIKIFITNQLMQQLAINQIWGTYKKGKLINSFRYTNEGNFIDINGKDFKLNEDGEICLVYPLDLSEQELLKWSNQLDEYEIKQPILQLKRDIMLPAIDMNTNEYVFDWDILYYSQSLRDELSKINFHSGFMAVGYVYEQFVGIFNNRKVKAYFNFSGMDMLESTPEDTCNIYNILFKDERNEPLNLRDVPKRILIEVFNAIPRVRTVNK